jgi:hypothetical protein
VAITEFVIIKAMVIIVSVQLAFLVKPAKKV